MGEVPAGAQARIRDFKTDPTLNGKACVSLGGSRERATIRLASGREVVVPAECVQVIVAAGRVPAGTRVVLVGLAKAPELNGRFGSVAPSYSPPAGRLLVDLGSGAPKALKFENVVLLDPDAIANTVCDLSAHSPGSRVKISNFIDPGINGLTGIVLDRDTNDPSRLLVMLPSQGKPMSFRPDNLSSSGSEASASELLAIRSPLKDAFYLEVRKFLWGLPLEQSRLLPLLSPPGASKANPWSAEARVLSAWTAYRGACPGEEPLLRTTLGERSDLFQLSHDAAGYEVVNLTEAGRQLNRDEGIPEPPTKRRKVEADSGKQGKNELARALFCALQLFGAEKKAIPMSQLGSDAKVAALRKDPRFRQLKLTDLLREYPQVFELTPEPPPGTGLQVRLTDDAEAALPQRTAGEAAPTGGGDVLPDPEELRLPDRIERPGTLGDKMQALRIELIHALFRRDGRAEPQQLGQEPGVQKIKRELPKSKTLLDCVRVFLDNFSVVLDESTGKHQVQLDSMDVEDMSCIEEFVAKRQ